MKKNQQSAAVPVGDQLQELVKQIEQIAALPKECAEIMNMTVDNVRNYCRRGRFENAVQFGNEWLIPRETIAAYMENKRLKPGRAPRKNDEEPE